MQVDTALNMKGAGGVMIIFNMRDLFILLAAIGAVIFLICAACMFINLVGVKKQAKKNYEQLDERLKRLEGQLAGPSGDYAAEAGDGTEGAAGAWYQADMADMEGAEGNGSWQPEYSNTYTSAYNYENEATANGDGNKPADKTIQGATGAVAQGFVGKNEYILSTEKYEAPGPVNWGGVIKPAGWGEGGGAEAHGFIGRDGRILPTGKDGAPGSAENDETSRSAGRDGTL